MGSAFFSWGTSPGFSASGPMFFLSSAIFNLLNHGIKKTSQQTGRQRETSFPFDLYGNAAHSLTGQNSFRFILENAINS